MKNYEPSLGVKETALNIRHFVKAYMPVFWAIFKPMMPYVAFFYFLDAVATSYFQDATGKNEVFIGSIFAAYFYTALAISWHRVVIQGPENYVPMNPFKPKKSELAFIGMGVVLTLIVIFIVIAVSMIGIVGANFIPGLQVLAILLSGFLAFYFIYKCGFYFPAKAVNNTITFRESMGLTSGYLLKLILAPMLASWRLLLAVIGYGFLGGLIIGIMAVLTGEIDINQQQDAIEAARDAEGRGIMPVLAYFIFLPVNLYFQPLLTIIGVTSLSNYYMHAMQNRNDSVTAR